MPTIGQFNYLYGNLAEVNNSLHLAGGSVFSPSEWWMYWSSTESSSYNAWTLNSSGALYSVYYDYYYHRKDSSWRVRGARNF